MKEAITSVRFAASRVIDFLQGTRIRLGKMSLVDFDLAVNVVLENEGGLEDSPTDPGGITKYGISLRFLREVSLGSLKRAKIFGEVTEQTIRNLTIDQAKMLYRSEFWEKIPLDKLINQDVVNYLFDMAVNIGINPTIKCAQRSCWAVLLNKDVFIDDGVMGNETIDSINHAIFYILPVLRSERAGYYRKLIVLNPSMIGDLEGWLNRTYKVFNTPIMSRISTNEMKTA